MTRPGTGFDSRACGTTPFLICQCREPAGVPGQTSPSTRAECKGHTGAAQPRKPGSLPGLRSRPMGQYLLLCVLFLTPRKDGAAAGGIPLPANMACTLHTLAGYVPPERWIGMYRPHGAYPCPEVGQILAAYPRLQPARDAGRCPIRESRTVRNDIRWQPGKTGNMGQ